MSPMRYSQSEPVIQNGHAATNGIKGKPGLRRNSSIIPLVPTTHKEDVPLVFREPHINGGFRQVDQPWHYYFLSIFQVHNEVMNVWTHLIAAIVMISKIWKYSHEVDFVNDAYTWPFLAGLICGSLLYVCSSGAHCFQSKSELVHYVAFMVDYAGIGLYGLGSVIVHYQYCSEDSLYELLKNVYLPVGCLLGFCICLCCTISKIYYTRPYPFTRKMWQMTPVGCIYIWLNMPIVHKVYNCYMYEHGCGESFTYHIHQILWFLASAIFFASSYPQKFNPGMCDFIGHSHQLFHICIMICTSIQMDGVFLDMQQDREHLIKRGIPTFMDAFGPVILVVGLEILNIAIFQKIAKDKIAKESKSNVKFE
ncbi:unnamed protein product [Owenia fusiformis]|uniref:Uncharacterized protein n=1 Tax=Owenia fusiformis TaxID=6347 RepID=A0A8J1TNT7_OWEFU|nr:unnamed protein product [Owenia fusiformis]